MNKSEQINELATALSKAQGMIKGAVKDSKNPFFKSDYADFESVVEAIREPLLANGLSFTQMTDEDDRGLFVETVILHFTGQWMSGRYPVICKTMDDPQKVGAALTYARRFSLSSAFGVPQIDDDGNEAAKAPNKPVVESKSEKPASDKAFENPIEQAKNKAWLDKKPSEAQIKRLFAVAKANNWTIDQIKATMKSTWGYESTSELTIINYDSLVHIIETMSAPEINLTEGEKKTKASL